MREERFGELDAIVTGGTDGEGGGDGPIVVLLHGFGAPGDDLVPLARFTEAPPGTRFVFPAGPIELPLGFGEARAWWQIDLARLEEALAAGRERDVAGDLAEGAPAARRALETALDAVEARLGAPTSRLVLGGFSQGAMLACDTALRSERPLAGLVLLSGTLLAAREWLPRMPSRRGLPVFQSHGRADPLLPFRAAESLRGHLADAGLPVEWTPFDGGHELPSTVLQALGRFLGRVARSGAGGAGAAGRGPGEHAG